MSAVDFKGIRILMILGHLSSESLAQQTMVLPSKTRQLVYFTDTSDNLYLSKQACIEHVELGLISDKFLNLEKPSTHTGIRGVSWGGGFGGPGPPGSPKGRQKKRKKKGKEKKEGRKGEKRGKEGNKKEKREERGSKKEKKKES